MYEDLLKDCYNEITHKYLQERNIPKRNEATGLQNIANYIQLRQKS